MSDLSKLSILTIDRNNGPLTLLSDELGIPIQSIHPETVAELEEQIVGLGYNPDAVLVSREISVSAFGVFEACRIIRRIPNGGLFAIIAQVDLNNEQERLSALSSGASALFPVSGSSRELELVIDSITKANTGINRPDPNLVSSKAEIAQLDALSHMVAHDLRSPLSGVFGFSDALLGDLRERQDEIEEEWIELVELIQVSAKRANDTIDSLSFFATIRERKLAYTDVELSDAICDAVASYRNHPSSQALDLNVAETAKGKCVRTDRYLLKNLLTTIIRQAEYLSDSSNTIQLSCSILDGESISLQMRISGRVLTPRHAELFLRPFDGERYHRLKNFPLLVVAIQQITTRLGITASWTPAEGANVFIFQFSNQQ